MMKSIFAALLLLLSVHAVAQVHPLFQPSPNAEAYDKPYSTFAEYLNNTEEKIRRTRYFVSNDVEAEVKANMPFELLPKKMSNPRKGVLLVHGLGDSPYSYVDVSQRLAEHGFLVRTILLDGHGTRPGDMINADHEKWAADVAKHVELLKKDVDEVYLGGFSTGGNLVYSYAQKDESIKGLMLFAPAFITNDWRAPLAPYVAMIRDWLPGASPEQERVYTRYMNTAINGYGEYYKTSSIAQDWLEKKRYTRPVFMVLSEHDSVLDVEEIREMFMERFSNSTNKLVWYGYDKTANKGKVRTIYSRNPELRISNMSHMGIMFSPDNPFYGQHVPAKICRNGQLKQGAKAFCEGGGEVWFGAHRTDEPGEVVARLTYNPQFDVMMKDLLTVFAKPE